MPVYEGVLEALGQGATFISSRGASNITVMSYVTVGGKRIRDVAADDYMSSILTENLGKEIKLSTAKFSGGRSVVMSLSNGHEVIKVDSRILGWILTFRLFFFLYAIPLCLFITIGYCYFNGIKNNLSLLFSELGLTVNKILLFDISNTAIYFDNVVLAVIVSLSFCYFFVFSLLKGVVARNRL